MRGMGIMITGLAFMAATAVFADEAAEEQGWEHTIALGFTLTDGNTETTLGNATWLSTWEQEDRELRLSAEGAYGETEDQTTTENAKAEIGYRRTFSEWWYGLGSVLYSYDSIADVDYRVIASPGIGWYALKNDKVTLGLEVGPAYISEKVGGITRDYVAIRFAERYERQLSETAKIWQYAEYIPKADDWESNLILAELGVEAALNAHMNLRFVIKDTYDSEPAEDKEENDLTVIAALSMTL